jgi:catechol 2,3-dioxygenase-like lactoylglutathione lyase family enzyme
MAYRRSVLFIGRSLFVNPDTRVSQYRPTVHICRERGADVIRHIAGIGEVVEDVDSAVAFYEALGVSVKREGPDYAIADVPGVLHFGIWSRAAAAESTFGTRDAADRVPLGFSIGIEVDDVDEAGKSLGDGIVRGAQDEPWGQRTLRFTSPSGALCEVCASPWARELETNVTPKATEPATP